MAPDFYFALHGLVPSDFGKSSIVNVVLRPRGVFYIPSMSGDGTVISRDHASQGDDTQSTMLRAKFVHFVTVLFTTGFEPGWTAW